MNGQTDDRQNQLLNPTRTYAERGNYFPYSAPSINATAWSHSTPQTLTSTSKQILHYNKHLYHSCWYLKGNVYKAVASCENCETISGDYKSAMAQVTCSMEYGICTLGKTYCCPRVWVYGSGGTNPIQLETHGTTITLLSTPFNAHPNLQSPQTNPTIHNKYTHNHSKTTNRELWCVCWKDRCRDGNLRTYCHVSPILFGWKPALHVFAFL